MRIWVEAHRIITMRHRRITAAKVVRELTPDELKWKIEGTRAYQNLAVRSLKTESIPGR